MKKDDINTIELDLDLDIDTNIVNIRYVSV